MQVQPLEAHDRSQLGPRLHVALVLARALQHEGLQVVLGDLAGLLDRPDSRAGLLQHARGHVRGEDLDLPAGKPRRGASWRSSRALRPVEQAALQTRMRRPRLGLPAAAAQAGSRLARGTRTASAPGKSGSRWSRCGRSCGSRSSSSPRCHAPVVGLEALEAQLAQASGRAGPRGAAAWPRAAGSRSRAERAPGTGGTRCR